MKINPLLDTWDFLIHGGPLGPIFLLLLIVPASAAVAKHRHPNYDQVEVSET